MKFLSAREIAKKWNISQRRVAILCAENRINGADRIGNMWVIPKDAPKPIDGRSIRYDKKKSIPLKPFVKWVGGKSQLLSQIEKHLPIDGEKVLTKYVEPFVGGGALLFYMLSKYNFEKVYIGDINAELINAYKVIKNNVQPLIEKLKIMQVEYIQKNDDERKTYYYSARERFNKLKLSSKNTVEKSALFIFLNKTCFNGLYRVNKKGEFNVPMGAYKNPTICDEINLINVSKALKNVTIVCDDFEKSKEIIDENTFIYLDPPYRPISETSGFTAYNAFDFGDKEQVRLANYINQANNVGAKIMLSNSDPQNVNVSDTFFVDLYRDYKINKIEATRAINSNAEKRGKIKELLICN